MIASQLLQVQQNIPASKMALAHAQDGQRTLIPAPQDQRIPVHVQVDQKCLAPVSSYLMALVIVVVVHLMDLALVQASQMVLAPAQVFLKGLVSVQDSMMDHTSVPTAENTSRSPVIFSSIGSSTLERDLMPVLYATRALIVVRAFDVMNEHTVSQRVTAVPSVGRISGKHHTF